MREYSRTQTAIANLPYSVMLLTGAPVGVFQVNGLGWLTVCIVAPLVGGLLGGFLSRIVFKLSYAG
jgi:hypothetical protein